MIWLFAIIVVLVIGGLVTLAVVRGEQAQPAYDDRPEVRLPADRPLRSADLSSVRFTTAARGYRMAEVDALLARLRAEMAEREDGHAQQVDPSDVTAPLRGEPTDPEPVDLSDVTAPLRAEPTDPRPVDPRSGADGD